MTDQNRPQNRLIREKSPYLLQHARNPIDWYPWCEEAFRKAHDEDKPVFLSIGYSSCHWCHVMEHESFEDDEVAALMNRSFVAIKVDREERPDIDSLYMAVCQSLTGSGGWPLTTIMTPDKKPFFAGTYFPKQSWHGRPGLMELLRILADAWKTDKEDLVQAGDRITKSLRDFISSPRSGSLSEGHLEQAYQMLERSFDGANGGFGAAPKFPIPHQLSFLLRWWKRSGEKKALEMVERTLDAMMRGGIYDHLGFGFHRYSTDPRWLVPHFEKMLYDQALIALAFIDAYQATSKPDYAKAAREIFAYVLRDMTSPEGAFYSSEDADSEGREGKFYTWTLDEIMEILGDGDLLARYYGVTESGNFEGENIPHVPVRPEEFARDNNIEPERLEEKLERSRRKLFEHREKRTHPFKDDKILTDWNGLMIAALARGAQAFNEKQYAVAARRAADFILKKMRGSAGQPDESQSLQSSQPGRMPDLSRPRLLHRYRDGDAAIAGYLNDHAFLVWGLIELYETTFEAIYLREALSLTEDMIRLFKDEKAGGFFLAARDDEQLPVNTKEVYDGALPSGNSVAAFDLVRLGRITGREDIIRHAEKTMESFGATISELPAAFSKFLIALDFAIGPTKEIVIAGEPDDEDTRKMLDAIRSRFIPGKVLILNAGGEAGRETGQLIPHVKDLKKIDGRATAYICENFRCKLPTTDLQEMVSLLDTGK